MLLASSLLATPTTAHDVPGSHIFGSCVSGNSSANEQPRVDPLTHTPDTYDYVAGTATVQDLYACSPQNGTTNYGWTIVTPASMLVQNGALVQFGYGVCPDVICNLTWPSVTTEEF